MKSLLLPTLSFVAGLIEVNFFVLFFFFSMQAEIVTRKIFMLHGNLELYWFYWSRLLISPENSRYSPQPIK